jgi:hypothetical protein
MMDSETDAGSFCTEEDEIPAEAKEVDDGKAIDCLPRSEDMKAAAELVFALEEIGPNDHMEIEEIYSLERNEEYSLPAGSYTGIPSGDEIAMPNENHSIHENRRVIGSRVIEQNPNLSSLETRRIPPAREVIPGACAVRGPDGNQSEGGTLNPPSVNPTIAVSAQLVDTDEESRIVSKRAQRALQRERERAAVAHVISDGDLQQQSILGWFRKRWRLAGVIGFVYISTIIIVSVTIVATRKQPTSPFAATPVPTQAPSSPPMPTTLSGPAPTEESGRTTSVAPKRPDTTHSPFETVVPTEMPVTTEVPTEMPVTTGFPTTAPTRPGTTPSPTHAGVSILPAKFPNLSMTLSGATTLSESSWKSFDESYLAFNRAFYSANPQFGVSDVDILLELVSQEPPGGRRLGERQLQGTLTLIYNEAMTYKIIPGSSLEPADVVTQPFATQTSRDAFANLLQRSGDAAFASIDTVSHVTQEPAPGGRDGGGLSVGAVIGIVVSCVTVIGLLFVGGYMCRGHMGKKHGEPVEQAPTRYSNPARGNNVDRNTRPEPYMRNASEMTADRHVFHTDEDHYSVWRDSRASRTPHTNESVLFRENVHELCEI